MPTDGHAGRSPRLLVINHDWLQLNPIDQRARGIGGLGTVVGAETTGAIRRLGKTACSRASSLVLSANLELMNSGHASIPAPATVGSSLARSLTLKVSSLGPDWPSHQNVTLPSRNVTSFLTKLYLGALGGQTA